jgi:hypothetical protein
MRVFHYHPDTGALLGPGLADASPMEPGTFLVPAYATELEPPDVGPGQVAVFRDGAWSVEPEPAPEPPLAPTVADLCARIDAAAEQVRARYITPGAGQAMEYEEATRQARAALAVGVEPEAGAYPMLDADVQAGTINPGTGEPVASVLAAAGVVVAMRQQYEVIGADIRRLRLAAKAAVRAAATQAEREAAAVVAWPSP